jgi:hypothetical protein
MVRNEERFLSHDLTVDDASTTLLCQCGREDLR